MSRVSWKDIFAGFQLTVLEIKLTFMKRKVVFHTATLTHCEARQVLGDFFNTNQEMAQKWHLWQELIKLTITFENLAMAG